MDKGFRSRRFVDDRFVIIHFRQFGTAEVAEFPIVGQPFEAAVLLGAALGLRRCEACAVRIEDVDWQKRSSSCKGAPHCWHFFIKDTSFT